MEVTIPITVLLEILAFVGGLAVVWGTIRGELRQLRKEAENLDKRISAEEAETKRLSSIETRIHGLEGLSAKVDRIDPLIERVTQFERHMGEKVDGLARTLDDLRTLLFKAAAKSGA
jgi:hypothetical protein